MGELQFDHVAIPRLVFLAVALAIAQGRERGPEAMRAMLGRSVIAQIAQALAQRIIRDRGVAAAGENEMTIARPPANLGEDGERLSRQRDHRLLVPLHLLARSHPARYGKIELAP